VALREGSNREGGVDESRIAVLVALRQEIQALFDNGRHAQTVARYDGVVQRFVDDPDPLVQKRVWPARFFSRG